MAEGVLVPGTVGLTEGEVDTEFDTETEVVIEADSLKEAVGEVDTGRVAVIEAERLFVGELLGEGNSGALGSLTNTLKIPSWLLEAITRK